LRHGKKDSAAVVLCRNVSLSEGNLCLTIRALEESKPGKLVMCAISEFEFFVSFLLARSDDDISLAGDSATVLDHIININYYLFLFRTKGHNSKTHSA
jgi:hypothetical protein